MVNFLAVIKSLKNGMDETIRMVLIMAARA